MNLDLNDAVNFLYNSMDETKVLPKVSDLKGAHFQALIRAAKVFEFDFSNLDILNVPDEFKAANDFAQKALEYECFSIPFPICLYAVRTKSQSLNMILCVEDKTSTAFFNWFIDAHTHKVYMNPARGWVENKSFLKYGQSTYFAPISNNGSDAENVTQTPVTLTSLLCCGGIEHELISPSRQVTRAAKRNKEFAVSFTRLNIRDCGKSSSRLSDKAGSHGVRAHWRRGHFRRLASGAVTSVRPCLVGDKSLGFVGHDYGYSFT